MIFAAKKIYFLALHSVCLRILGVWTQIARALRFVEGPEGGARGGSKSHFPAQILPKSQFPVQFFSTNPIPSATNPTAT